MPLHIIGAGYGRTGTNSTQQALNLLGYNCYHMYEVLNNPKNKTHADFWLKVSNSTPGEQHNWDEVFENYNATVDNPGCCVWKELFEANPEAKVLLTLHPKGPKAWYKSTMNTIYFSEKHWEYKFLGLFIPRFRKLGTMFHNLIWRRSHKGTMDNPDAAIERYHAHIAEVKGIVPLNQLLIFSVDQGWDSLCKFLEVPVPEQPFPNLNNSKEFKKIIRRMKGLAYFIIILIVAAIYFIVRWL